MRSICEGSGLRANARGFTLIELLVVLIILGVLVGIALNVTSAKDKAYLAVMQSDLHNLLTAQESYFVEYGSYAKGNDLNFQTSPDVTLLDVAGAPGGWSARVQHKKRTDIWCAVYVGNAKPIFAPAEAPGVINCDAKGGGGAGSGAGAGGGKGKGPP